MNIKQRLTKVSNQTKSSRKKTRGIYFILLLIALLVSPVVWVSLFFISSYVLQHTIMILACIIICSLFLKIADENPSLNNYQNKSQA